jgi:hypothetical protein
MLSFSGCGGSDSAAPKSYNITGNASSGGSILPKSVSVNAGGTTTFKITPDNGYEIQSVEGCNGSLNGFDYLTAPVNTECSVSVKFKAKVYEVSSSASVGGTIEPKVAAVEFGKTTTFKVVSNTDFELVSVQGCDGKLSGTDYVTSPVNSSCSVKATFKQKPYQISTVIKGSGSVTPATQYMSLNEQAKITINELPQTKLAQISGCNGSMDGLVYTTAPVTQSCQIAIEFNSLPLVTIVSDQALKLGDINVISSEVTDPDGDLVTYHWSLESAPVGGDSEADAILKSERPYIFLSPTVPGDYVFGLIVNDGIHNSHKVTKTLTAAVFSLPPEVWVFHSDIAKMGDIVDMDASGTTDPDNDSFELTWEVVSAPEPVVLDLSTYRHAKFEPRKLGDYKFKVFATDEHGGVSEPLHVSIRVIAPNENGAPVARAGNDQRINLGTMAVLDGGGSFDAEGDILSYQWRFVSKPGNSVVEIGNDRAQQANFTPDVAGDYVVELLVSDGKESSSETLLIKVIGPTVVLYSKDPIFGGYQPTNLPYNSSGSMEEPANGREQIVISEFQLVAESSDFVIENLAAVDTTNQVVPQILGLSNGLALQPNTPVEFKLVSPTTSGRLVKLQFKFNIKGTDLTFYSEVQLKTN